MFKKRLTVLCLTMTMAVSMAHPVMADTQSDIANAQSAKNAAESSLDNTNQQIEDMQSQKDDLQTYLLDLNTQIENLSDNLTDLDNQINQKNIEIENTKAAVVRAQDDEESQYSAMETRIQYMYENGSTDLLTTIVESESITDFINRVDEISAMNDYDRSCLEDYKTAKATVEQKQSDLEDQQGTLESLKNNAEVQKNAVSQLAATTDDKISEYTANISDAELEASDLQDKINTQKSLLTDLQNKAAAEEAARQKAAEEAARVAELAAQKAAADQAAADQAATEKAAAESSTTQSSSGTSSDVSAATDTGSNSNTSDNTASSDTSQSTTDNAGSTSSSESASTSTGKYLGNFMLTAYCPCAKCCGRANAPTASGVMPTAGHTVAMAGVPFGTKLLINGTIYTVEDRGTPYGHVDIFMNEHSTCLQFGVAYADVYEVD